METPAFIGGLAGESSQRGRGLPGLDKGLIAEFQGGHGRFSQGRKLRISHTLQPEL